MIQAAQLREKFRSLTGREPRIFSAPGRVNLIGEHTDYNDGFVLPIALGQRIWVAAAPRQDNRLRCWSTSYNLTAAPAEFSIEDDHPLEPTSADWTNHIRGVATVLMQEKYHLGGADLLI
ncbi:MAG: galactokinase, partial [Acidobacteria bacterium]|nr:galactokinase [Acidobacteriota bacterium]